MTIDPALTDPPSSDSNRRLFDKLVAVTDEYAKPTLRDDMIDTAWQAIDDRTDYDAGPRELAAAACDALYDAGYWSPAMIREQIDVLRAIWPHKDWWISIHDDKIRVYRDCSVAGRGETYEEAFTAAAAYAREKASRVMVAADLGM